jgi:formylglycine-generating enzyme required for sulfatase activity
VYPWGDKWEGGICNSAEAQLGGSSAVGIFPRDESPFGLKDMAGNVWEWCADSWEKGGSNRVYRGGGWAGDATDCRAACRDRIRGSTRVYRGGSWAAVAGFCRAACRSWLLPSFRFEGLGFRLARTVSSPSR